MDFPKRKRHRLADYDYSSPGYYFVTICTYEKQHLLSVINPGDSPGQWENKLTVLGKIVQETLECIPNHFANVRIDKSVIMPNHLHAIIVLEKEEHRASLSDIICAFKSLAVMRCREKGFLVLYFKNHFTTISSAVNVIMK